MQQLRSSMVGLLLLFPLMCLGQRDAWLPVTEQEKNLKEVPGSPGAEAIQLYYAEDIDDNSSDNNAEWDYRRIKILTDKGKDYANIEIVVPSGFHLQSLKARTIHPDGSVVDFTGKPFDKVIVKGSGFKYQGKSFTFPDVTIGSIIEYRYKMDYPANLIPYHVWEIQHELYTLKEKFKLRAYRGAIQNVEGMTGVSASYNLPPGLKLQKKSDGWELEVENMPAFQPEAYMPPPQPYIYRVSFRYGGRDMAKAEKFWQATGLKLYDATEAFIGNHKEVRQAAEQAIAGDTDPEKKLRKLYARAQQIRNLTYERPRTEAEQKKEDLKNNNTSVEVLERGYGDSGDIALFFVAMARAAGFEAYPMMSTDRSERMFEPILLDESQLQTLIVMVKLNGTELLLDPGTRFCPFGSLRWSHTATQGLLLTKGGGVMVNVPLAPQTKAILERTANVAIDSDGAAKGDITVRYSGYEALERRLEALQTDEAGRNKKLEDEVKQWLPNGAVVKLKDAQPWEPSEQPLEAHFSVMVPSYASIAGKRLLAPNYLFRTVQKDAFAHQERKYPVYFRYAFAEVDNVNIKVPMGLTMETLPQQQDATLPYARYQSLIKFEGQQIATRRALLLGQNFFPLEKYQELKDFFSKVQAGDEQQAVLQGGTQSAQK
jgi:Domain of Unknown Function with PDB structure (DUF3857)/Transglutaminase-like superfamily